MCRAGAYGRVIRLLQQLPETSRLAQVNADRAPDHVRQSAGMDTTTWSLGDQLLATISDQLSIANWQRSGGKGKKPELLTDSKKRRRGKPDVTAVDTFGAQAVRDALDKLGGVQR